MFREKYRAHSNNITITTDFFRPNISKQPSYVFYNTFSSVEGNVQICDARQIRKKVADQITVYKKINLLRLSNLKLQDAQILLTCLNESNTKYDSVVFEKLDVGPGKITASVIENVKNTLFNLIPKETDYRFSLFSRNGSNEESTQVYWPCHLNQLINECEASEQAERRVVRSHF